MYREDPKFVSFPVHKVSQPIGEFYVGVMNFQDLCDITRFDVRRMVKKRDVETYLGIQRPLNPRRVEELRKYVNTIDATFPTSIIIAVGSECAIIDEASGNMILSNYLDVQEDEEPIYYKNIAGY